MTIEEVRALCKDDTIKMTTHVHKRMDQRGIRYDEVIETIMSGVIIEDYPTAYPYPACLILGWTADDRALHVCAGSDGSFLWIITAYEPDLTEWHEDLITLKEEN